MKVNLLKQVFFVTGIDTDSGKSFATGILARWLMSQGKKVITQKLVQTGCVEQSDDILLHRKLMGIPLQEVDLKQLTAPYIFPFPASPHLSAKLVEETISADRINDATNDLLKIYDIVLLEGAGGLLVPLNDEMTTADYITKYNLPVILVTSAKLGSINHTLLTLEAIKNRNLNLQGIIYNHFPKQNDDIANDTLSVIRKYMIKHNFNPVIANLPLIDSQNLIIDSKLDFIELFKNEVI